MKTKSLEIEFKYNAKEIHLQDFTKFCEKRRPINYKIVSGFDYFYSNSLETQSFYRFRTGDIKQLTFKKKTSLDDNIIRIEHNINLQLDMKKSDITNYCETFGYTYNTSIFKTCHVYEYDYYTLVYYVCYDEAMRELGRFIEIEMKEDYDWDNETHAMDELITMERICKPLGLNIKNRIKESLFELYKK